LLHLDDLPPGVYAVEIQQNGVASAKRKVVVLR